MKTAIIGLQFGDCGKGRVVSYFLEKDRYHWCVRFNGGGNAGHTVYDPEGKKYKFHFLPSGAAYPNTKLAIDTGAILHMPSLSEEIAKLDHIPDLYISNNVHIIKGQHLEDDAQGSGIGSTKKGTGPCYRDRAARTGTRVSRDMLLAGGIYAHLYNGLPPIHPDENVLFEGAQGIMLDVDYGAYPHVTSSSVMPSSAYRIDKVVGVMKAYTTRVGEGPPYSTDIPELRKVGQEFGTTTGRPRKCMWNDLGYLDYAMGIVQPDEIVITKMDVVADTGLKPAIYLPDGNLKEFETTDEYINFLMRTYPQIKYISYSPRGDMEVM